MKYQNGNETNLIAEFTICCSFTKREKWPLWQITLDQLAHENGMVRILDTDNMLVLNHR
jgi:hypothetical protein